MIAMVALAGVLLGARAAHLSITDGRGDQAFAAVQISDASELAARGRGDILSADGRKLATSHDTVRVIATPYQIQEPAKAADALASVIGPETDQSADKIEHLLTKRGPDGELSGYSVVATGVDPRKADAIWALRIDGITVAPDAVRVYPDGTLASQVTGHLGDYDEAFGGVEERYDDTLKNGEDVTLTLDIAVQQELEKALAETVEKNKARSAVGVMMRVDDGSIVALANVPSYDNNNIEEASAEAQRDRVLTDPYEPGSTFKAFTVASALEENVVTTDTRYVIADHMTVADRVIHDSQPHETEIMTPADVLRESSNVGAVHVAQDLGGRKLSEYIRSFGFGQATGVDLWGENPGVVPAYEDWSGSSIGNIPIGQGLSVTPLQLVSGYAALVNGGQRITPHVVKRDDPEPAGQRVISEKTSDIVRGMLQGVVDKGSGYKAQIPGYTVGGKTGTSQTVDPDTGTYGDEYVASFIGFVPATDPEYVALIAVDDPGTTYWGEVAAAPAFHDVMGFTLGYFNVPPDRRTSGAKAR
ncbi:MAG: penicillin-binding protein 2 [Rubrobacter sp.]|nr:penicillin-binding protein 2 [Rubrobacter sp.]